ncbi:MAG: glycosyltransferase [Chloroflexota bacterium]
MRFLCTSAQLPGHLDWGGYLQTAATLQQQGHDVLWVSGQEVAPLVQQAGVPFQAVSETGWRWPPPPPLPQHQDVTLSELNLQLLKMERSLDQWLEVNRVQKAVIELHTIAEKFQPDVILGEMFMAVSGLVAEMLERPFVVMGWPAPKEVTSKGSIPPQQQTNPVLKMARGRLDALLSTCDCVGVNWTRSGPPALRSPHLHITYWSPSWFSERDKSSSQTNRTAHVGGILTSTNPLTPPTAIGAMQIPSPDEYPWVFITLGTSFGNDPNFFIMAAQAAVQMGCLPILALGGQIPAETRPQLEVALPPSAIVTERVDYADILPFASAAIHHGGAGTTHACVLHGIPQFIVPHAGDQGRQAYSVYHSGVGLTVPPRQVTTERLVEGLALLLPDLSDYRAKAQQLKEEFMTLGGVKRAAGLLVNLGKVEATWG